MTPKQMTYMGNIAKNLHYGLLFQFLGIEGGGVVSAGKRAICDRVHFLKLARKCAIAFLCTLFFLGLTLIILSFIKGCAPFILELTLKDIHTV